MFTCNQSQNFHDWVLVKIIIIKKKKQRSHLSPSLSTANKCYTQSPDLTEQAHFRKTTVQSNPFSLPTQSPLLPGHYPHSRQALTHSKLEIKTSFRCEVQRAPRNRVLPAHRQHDKNFRRFLVEHTQSGLGKCLLKRL